MQTSCFASLWAFKAERLVDGDRDSAVDASATLPNSLEMSRPASQASVSAILGVASRAAPSSCQAPLCGKHLPKSTEDFTLG